LEKERVEKKALGIRELVAIVGLMVAIIVAGTSLLSSVENVPWWWFHFSFIVLIALSFSIPIAIFIRPISRRIKKFRLKSQRNKVSRKHFSQFKDLVDTAFRFSSDVRSIEESLRTHYKNEIKSSLVRHVLQNHAESELRNAFFEIKARLDEFNKSFRDLYLIMGNFEFCLNIYTRHLKIIEEFVHEIMYTTNKPIVKGIEANFEAFREKFNYFVKDFRDYCQKVNQELGERMFPEWAIDYVKKW